MKGENLSSLDEKVAPSTLKELDLAIEDFTGKLNLKKTKIPVDQGGPFYWVSPHLGNESLPEIGYKIHISVGLDHVLPALRKVVPYLIKNKIHFKYVFSGKMASAINSGMLGLTQVGKIITIYPVDLDVFYEAIEGIRKLTSGLVGPNVPSDQPVPNSKCMFYRFGNFLERNTNVEDSRLPGDAIPKNVRDPFPVNLEKKTIIPKSHPKISLIAGRFLIYDVLRQRGKGGVYKAYDTFRHSKDLISRPRPVVVKEARLFGERGLDGNDAQDRLRQQAQVLRLLSDKSPYFCKCIDYTSGDNSEFLVLEYLAGYSSIRERILSGQRPSSFQKDQVLRMSEEALKQMHDAGYVWCDFSADNILVNDEWNQIAIADVEDSIPKGSTNFPVVGTPGFIYEGSDKVDGKFRDLYALDCLKHYFCDVESFAKCLEDGDFSRWKRKLENQIGSDSKGK